MKNILKIILTIFVILSIFAVPPTVAFALPGQFDETFVGALDEKVDALESTSGEKIVVIGGSSVAFGVDSEMIESYTGMPVINFGLYASLGTKLMLDLSRKHIGKGDVVVLAPELDAQTLSMYFNSDTTLRALDGRLDILLDVPFTHAPTLLASTWSLAADKIGYILGGTGPSAEGAYRADNFNAAGDLVYPRGGNILPNYYDPNTKINLVPEILDKEFLDYLNEYIEDCEKRGASVLFSYCPMNELALTDAPAAEFADYLASKINATFISDIEDYILPAGYFYDTNFHLNNSGVIRHTATLCEDLLLELGIPVAIEEKVPEPPPLPQIDVRYFDYDPRCEYFTYARLADGSYMISGVKEEYLSLKELTVPLGYDSYKVTQLGSSFLKGSACERLNITEDTNITLMMNGAFSGASNLKSLYIYYETEQNIAPPADFRGVASGFKVYVPEGSSYSTGYYWSERGLQFEYIKED